MREGNRDLEVNTRLLCSAVVEGSVVECSAAQRATKAPKAATLISADEQLASGK